MVGLGVWSSFGLWTMLTHGVMTGLRRPGSRMASAPAVAENLHQ